MSDDTDKRGRGGDTHATPRHTPEAPRTPRRRPPVTHLDSPATRDALCELLGVSPRTVQRRIHAGDITREEGEERPWYSLHDSKWTRAQLARSGWRATPGGAIHDRDDATPADTLDDTPSGPPWKVAHEDLAERLEGLAEDVASVEGLAARVENVGDELDATREELANVGAELEELRAELEAGVSHGTHEDTGGDSGASERVDDDRRAEALTGWRAVCMAVLVRLKLLLDTIINTIKGDEQYER